MQVKVSQTALILTVSILVVGMSRLHTLKAQPLPISGRAIHFKGRVLDSLTGKSIEAARIKILPSEKGLWRTDEQGRFSFWVPDNMGERVEIEDDGYRTVSVDAKLGIARDIRLEPSMSGSASQLRRPRELMPASQSVAPAIVIGESRPKASGLGDVWSPWYRLGVAKAPNGYTIQSDDFWLTGDRACGAWAECREVIRNNNEVLWEFRLQGHNEIGAPARTFSTAHIRVMYRSEY
jgi:hypothetical protein